MQNEIVKISGMKCNGCVDSLEQALKAVPGVSDAKVSLVNHQANIQFNEGQATRQQLKSAIEKAGYSVETIGLADAAPPKSGCCN